MKKKAKLISWSKTLFAILIPLAVLLAPSEWILPGMTVVEHRVLALFILAALFWILEPIPVFATSVLVIVLELLLISDQGFNLLRQAPDGSELPNLLDYKKIFYTFSSPVIMLILGGFFLAMAATKYRLDQSLAGILLKPFGSRPQMVLLGLMIITGVFSMFMSNTATTAMMLAIIVPILKMFDAGDPGRIAFSLGIPFAANIGGLGSPIGSPPNAIALQFMGNAAVGFGEWVLFAVPFVVVMLLLAWGILLFLFPFRADSLQIEMKARFLHTGKANIVYLTFIVTLLLWLTDFLHGMNSYVVAMIPVAVFLSAGILGRSDLKTIDWDVLWLLAGGVALGLALEESGLAQRMVSEIPFAGMPAYLVLLIASFVGLALANFMSHTGTANLLLPIVAALGASGLDLGPIGGAPGLILGVTFSLSLGMSLPISTPPNALAQATGGIKTGDMAKAGVLVGLLGLGTATLLVYLLKAVNFFPS